MRNEEYNRKAGIKTFGNKQFHAKHPQWPTKLQQEHGGWWECRSGPDASPPERDCMLCNPPPGRRAPPPDEHFDPPRGSTAHRRQRSEGIAKRQYDLMTTEIQKCMDVVKDMDKRAVLAKANIERANAEDEMRTENWQWRGGWLSQGVRLATSAGSTSREPTGLSQQPQGSLPTREDWTGLHGYPGGTPHRKNLYQ